jgi:hypothetical protein
MQNNEAKTDGSAGAGAEGGRRPTEAGTLARIDAVLDAPEKRADFLRDTVEAEIKRRERKKRPRTRRKA